MSQRALCLGLRDSLRVGIPLGDEVCDLVEPPGKPPAYCGELFVGVWEGGVSNPTTESRSDQHRANVTITRRVPMAPLDREMEEMVHKAHISLELMAEKIAAYIHTTTGGYDVLDRANQYICDLYGESVYGFSEPLRFLDMTRTEKKNGDWFHGDPREASSGRVITVFLGKALRLQSLAAQT